MTLVVKIYKQPYRFNASPKSSGDTVVTNVALIHRSRNHHIYSGDLSPADGDPSHTSRVVVKCAMTRSAVDLLEKEHQLYNGTLSPFQGVWLPRCHGMYHRQPQREPYACLVLEHCGEPVTPNDCLNIVSVDFKMKLVEAVKTLHRLDIVHNNLIEENILNHNGNPVIIDFALATKEKCKRRYRMRLGDIELQDEEEFGCRELYNLGYHMAIWRPPYIRILGEDYPITWMSDVVRIADTIPDVGSPEETMRSVCRDVKYHLQQWYPEVWPGGKEWEQYVDSVSAWYKQHRRWE